MLKVSNISKEYRVGKGNGESFFALYGISFSAEGGEIIGVLGRNGSGKSTLLKVISGLVSPTSGSVSYSGEMSSLLEIGGGIHPELSGKENYLLKGRLLGLSNDNLNRNYQSLLDFTELGKFIHEPVKNYSNGMYMRLALGIGLTVKADIYLFDEVLSVGDLAFQKKCLETVRKLKEHGALVLIVSHNLNEIDAYCDRFMVLKEGKLVADGANRSLLTNYISESLLNENGHESPIFKNSNIQVEQLHISSPNGFNSNVENLLPIELKLDIRAFQLIKPFNITIHIQDHTGVPIFSIGTAYNPQFEQEMKQGISSYVTTIPEGFLNPDFYSVSLYIHSMDEVVPLRNIRGFQVKKSETDDDLQFYKGKIRTKLTLHKL